MLKLNDYKTEALHITSKHRRRDEIRRLHIGESQITTGNRARDLGTIITSYLCMQNQINNICRSSSLALHKIGRIRKYLDQQTTERLVHAFISCRLDFCNSLLHCLPIAQISKLQRIQNSAARLVTYSSPRQHITPVLRSLHWLPVSKLIEFKLLLLTYKSLHQSAPHYLQELLHPHVPHRTLRSSSTSQLVPYITRTKSYGHRSFSHSSPSLWNNLPHNIRTAPNDNIFKHLLKTYLFTH